MEYRFIDGGKVAYAVLRNNIEAAENENAGLHIALKMQNDLVAANAGGREDVINEWATAVENTQVQIDQNEKRLTSLYAQIDALPKSAAPATETTEL